MPVVLFLFCFGLALLLCVAVLHIRPSMLQYLHPCLNDDMLYMLLGQKSVSNTLVLFNCIFGKYKSESGDICPHVPHVPSTLFFSFQTLFMSNFLVMLSHDKRSYPFTCAHLLSHSFSLAILETYQVSTLVDTFPSPESR